MTEERSLVSIVLTSETAGLIVLLIETALRLSPIIAEAIANMNLSDRTQEEYRARIKAAQDDLPPWE